MQNQVEIFRFLAKPQYDKNRLFSFVKHPSLNPSATGRDFFGK
ncbi:hypothetical protein [Helicobacter sp. MIT 01-3238]|nr:hypothetical protein [Helicobacter sp. MIT 01-3238]